MKVTALNFHNDDGGVRQQANLISIKLQKINLMLTFLTGSHNPYIQGRMDLVREHAFTKISKILVGDRPICVHRIFKKSVNCIHLLSNTNSMAYGTRRFNAAFIRALHNPYPEPNQPNSSY